MTYRQIWRRETPDFHQENLGPGTHCCSCGNDSVHIFGWIEPYMHHFICLTFLFLESGKCYFGPFQPY